VTLNPAEIPTGSKQENRDHHLREIEANLRDGGVEIATAERPPSAMVIASPRS
jgi:hypothetical protein